ncbi:MAG: glycerol-3-phosphate dehydrogenase/oxidase, partial [Candidatus Heimdallarchaeota archaeon]
LFYYDGMMDDARVTLEVILSAQDCGALCLNHIKVEKLNKIQGPDGKNTIATIIARDTLSNEEIEIQAKIVVNATGPWTDDLIGKAIDKKSKILRTTKGIHVITKRIVKEDVITVITADDERGMFVIPFRKDYSLTGTTDTYFDSDMDHVDITQDDIDYVISAINNDFPGSVTKDDVISAYSGIRPLLISPKAKAETDTSRWFEIIKVLPNFFTITGGKYTIFRYMAEKMVDRLVKELQFKKKDYKCTTKKTFVHGGEGIEDIEKYLANNVPKISKKYKLEEDIAEHVVNTYGTMHTEVMKFIKADKALAKRIAKGRPHIFAEVHYAVTNEMCLTLSDFMLRRSQLQLLNHQGLDCAEKIAKEMGKILAWNEVEIKKQYSNYKKDLVWNP